MNKEIKDRLDKLENELKESKDEIHSLKSSVSLKIERGIRKLLSRFTRKQIILGSVIVLLSISIIGIAGTVTKTYTFSSGDVVSASKINTNFDNLYTLVNGNLDDSNISGISGSKITSGTVAAARLDNLSGSKITSGTVAAARIDNLDGSKITSGTVAAARLDNLSGSMITSGTVAAARIDDLDGSNISIDPDSIVFFATHATYTGNLGGRSGADAICLSNMDNKTISMVNNSCSNVRAVISIDANDEIIDMAANYGIPRNVDIRGSTGTRFGTSWDNFTSATYSLQVASVVAEMDAGNSASNVSLQQSSVRYWTGSDQFGEAGGNCSNFSTESSSTNGNYGDGDKFDNGRVYTSNSGCNYNYRLLCICY